MPEQVTLIAQGADDEVRERPLVSLRVEEQTAALVTVAMTIIAM